jgi:uncharacterized protein YycO
MEILLNKTRSSAVNRNYTMDKNCDLIKTLQPQDIVLYRFNNEDFLGQIIAHFTSSPYSHAEIFMWDGYTITAASNGVGFIDLYQKNIQGQPFIGKHMVDIFRVKGGLTREKRLIIQSKALQSVMRPYDYKNLMTFPFISEKDAIECAGNQAYICSELVSWTYKNAGIDLIANRLESLEAPADIARSSILDYIGTFEEGKKVDKDVRNELYKQSFNVEKEFLAHGIDIISKRDEFYAGMKINNAIQEGTIS